MGVSSIGVFKGFLQGTKAALAAADLSAYPLHPVFATDAKMYGLTNASGVILWCNPVTDASYTGATRTLQLQLADGTAKDFVFPADNFLSAAEYDNETHVLTLTLTDDSTVEVDLEGLVDVVPVADTASVSLSRAGDGTLTADVNISEAAGNGATIKPDGLHVAVPQIFAITE